MLTMTRNLKFYLLITPSYLQSGESPHRIFKCWWKCISY